jgi:hypothetical protein
MRLIVKPPVFKLSPTTTEEVGLIQGQEPGSKEEWRVAKAHWRFEVPFIYQFEIFDSSVRGGIVLDFLSQTVPLSTPLEVYAKYWHKGERSSKERMRDVIVENYFRGKSQPLKIWFAKDLQDQDMVDAKFRREILA